MRDNNSIRGAAIALCVSVDELKQMLDGKVLDKLDGDKLKDVAEARATIAHLRSENARLEARVDELEKHLKAAQEIIVLRF